MEKRNINNNLCECYCENFGYSVWVQSDETGLWFNLNDIFKTFPLKEFDKRDIKKSLTLNDTEIYITFNRDNGEGDVYESFISESVVHHVIALSKKATFQAENFIFDIIKDYDITCVNINQQKLNTGQRIALHALKYETEHHKEVIEHYMKMLKDNTNIPEKFEEYQNEIEKEINENKPQYDEKITPHDVRVNESINARERRLAEGWVKVNGSVLDKAVTNLSNLSKKYEDLKMEEYYKEQKQNHPEDFYLDDNILEDLDWDEVLSMVTDTVKAFEEMEDEEIEYNDVVELNWDDLL